MGVGRRKGDWATPVLSKIGEFGGHGRFGDDFDEDFGESQFIDLYNTFLLDPSLDSVSSWLCAPHRHFSVIPRICDSVLPSLAPRFCRIFTPTPVGKASHTTNFLFHTKKKVS